MASGVGDVMTWCDKFRCQSAGGLSKAARLAPDRFWNLNLFFSIIIINIIFNTLYIIHYSIYNTLSSHPHTVRGLLPGFFLVFGFTKHMCQNLTGMSS